VKPVLKLIRQVAVKGIAHITGGGLVENVPRVLPRRLVAAIETRRWVAPPLFDWLRREGGVAEGEMQRVFNCGIGMVLVVDPADAARTQAMLARSGETVWRIGEIRRRRGSEPQIAID
jgi:phosphoribosylformylglycinamidine cyclo-ligase